MQQSDSTMSQARVNRVCASDFERISFFFMDFLFVLTNEDSVFKMEAGDSGVKKPHFHLISANKTTSVPNIKKNSTSFTSFCYPQK